MASNPPGSADAARDARETAAPAADTPTTARDLRASPKPSLMLATALMADPATFDRALKAPASCPAPPASPPRALAVCWAEDASEAKVEPVAPGPPPDETPG